MKLTEMHKNFINESARSIIDHSLPVKAVKNLDVPLIAIEKWQIVEGGFLQKRYKFENIEDRNRFVNSILNYESDKGHHAKLTLSNVDVTISLITHDVKKITELDKSYAKYADIIRRDIAYNSSHERR